MVRRMVQALQQALDYPIWREPVRGKAMGVEREREQLAEMLARAEAARCVGTWTPED